MANDVGVGRRAMLVGGPAALAAAATTGAAQAEEVAPQLEFCFRAFVTLAPPLELGAVDTLRNRFIAVTGGRVEGPRLQGDVLSGGGDWQSLRDDGLTTLEAKYTLRARDGALISVVNPGVRHGPPDVMRRLAAGERVDPTTYYFRASPRFSAPAGPHRWLMESTFVCVGKRWPESVELEFWRVA